MMISPRQRRILDETAAVLIGVLSAVLVYLMLLSLASCVAVAETSLVTGESPRTVEGFLSAAGISVVVVVGFVRFVRSAVPWLALDTPRSKLATQGLSLVPALVLAFFGVAPAVDPVGGAHPIAAQIAGGIVVAALASWGRDGLVRASGAARGGEG